MGAHSGSCRKFVGQFSAVTISNNLLRSNRSGLLDELYE